MVAPVVIRKLSNALIIRKNSKISWKILEINIKWTFHYLSCLYIKFDPGNLTNKVTFEPISDEIFNEMNLLLDK